MNQHDSHRSFCGGTTFSRNEAREEVMILAGFRAHRNWSIFLMYQHQQKKVENSAIGQSTLILTSTGPTITQTHSFC